MISLRKTAIIGLTSFSVLTAGVAVPAMAAPAKPSVDASRLDEVPADYSRYRRGNRGAAIAGAVGLGILGAAAIASSRRAYADPYYEDGYGYGGPVYAAPAYREPAYYGRPYYGPRSYDFRDNR